MSRLTDEELERMAVANEQLFWTPNQESMRLLIAEVRASRAAAKGRSWPGWVAVMDEQGETPTLILPNHESTLVPMSHKVIPGRFVEEVAK